MSRHGRGNIFFVYTRTHGRLSLWPLYRLMLLRTFLSLHSQVFSLRCFESVKLITFEQYGHL
jgi:hypothetical protein